jgi:hypothetical protein
MEFASETEPFDHVLSDREFEELLRKTWELIQGQRVVHPFERATETPSWT